MTKHLQKQLPAPHSPFQCWKIVKFKLLHTKSVKSTLHRGGEGQNARRAKFSNTYGQGCSLQAGSHKRCACGTSGEAARDEPARSQSILLIAALIGCSNFGSVLPCYVPLNKTKWLSQLASENTRSRKP